MGNAQANVFPYLIRFDSESYSKMKLFTAILFSLPLFLFTAGCSEPKTEVIDTSQRPQRTPEEIAILTGALDEMEDGSNE
ncbi:hypothetical protein [Rhodopirellula sallentina]|uniref:Uncharacterized protein n=1 Tax=Rhodopirellula sallentina SM41 TaxID=1263870 RepID=M5U8M1_9BACT|nr:hypothetical protein [Rhodopirellula sallentina]EMI57629.1 hypothetical protein RSSM_00924 [Rhodopirellula sallentina SM41]